MIETTISVSLSLNLFHSIWNAILLVFIILTGDGRRVCVWEESVSMDSTYIFLLWWHLFHRPGSQCGIVPTTNYMFRDGVGTHYEPPLDQSFIYYFIIPILTRGPWWCFRILGISVNSDPNIQERLKCLGIAISQCVVTWINGYRFHWEKNWGSYYCKHLPWSCRVLSFVDPASSSVCMLWTWNLAQV